MKNSEWLFSGVAIAVPIAIISWLRSFKNTASQQNQVSGENSTNMQAGRDISIGSFINKNTANQLSEALAKPDFHVKQIGFSGGGTPHQVQYTLLIENFGGDCFNVEIAVPQSSTCKFSKIPRGRSEKLRAMFSSSPTTLKVTVSGLDGNGVYHKKTFAGTRTNNGFTFQ